MSPESPHQSKPFEAGEEAVNHKEGVIEEEPQKSAESEDLHVAFERITMQVGEIKRVQENFLDTSHRLVIPSLTNPSALS